MKKARFLLAIMAVATMLLGTVAGLRDPLLAWRANRWLDELTKAEDAEALVILGKIGSLGDPGIPAMVGAMGSSRRVIAQAARRQLADRLDDWELLHARGAPKHLPRLAHALAQNVDTLGPDARRDAADLATRILRRPLDPNLVDRARVIVLCEAVLHASESSSESAATSSALAGNAKPSDALHETTDTEVPIADLAHLPGGNLTLDGSPPIRESMEADPRKVASEKARWFHQPKPDATKSPEGEPKRLDDSDAVSRPLVGASEKEASPAAARRVALRQNDLFTPLSLEMTRPGAAATAPDPALSSAETFDLIQQLRSKDSPEAAGARAELARRGFTEVHFELARQLLDSNAEVRKRLARTLPRLKSIEAEPWLLWLARDADAEVRAEVIALLATGNDPGLLATIERIARSDPDARVQRLAGPIASRLAERRF